MEALLDQLCMVTWRHQKAMNSSARTLATPKIDVLRIVNIRRRLLNAVASGRSCCFLTASHIIKLLDLRSASDISGTQSFSLYAGGEEPPDVWVNPSLCYTHHWHVVPYGLRVGRPRPLRKRSDHKDLTDQISNLMHQGISRISEVEHSTMVPCCPALWRVIHKHFRRKSSIFSGGNGIAASPLTS